MPVLRAAEQEGRLDGLTVVTTDLFPELVDWIRAGKVAATVYQRPLTQGRVALQALYRFLHHRERLPARQRIVPYVVMSSNLDLILERLSVDRARERGASSGTPRRGRAHAAPARAPRSPRATAAIVLSPGLPSRAADARRVSLVWLPIVDGAAAVSRIAHEFVKRP